MAENAAAGDGLDVDLYGMCFYSNPPTEAMTSQSKTGSVLTEGDKQSFCR